MFSIDNLPDVAKNKSEELKQVFIKAANSSLSKGRTEEEAEFAGIAAIKAFSRASGSLSKIASEPRKASKPSHVPSKEQIALLREQEAIKKAKEVEDKKVMLESLFAKANLPQGVDRNIIAANFDRHDRLVIVFDTGERITTNSIDIKSYVENYVSITGSGGSSTGGVSKKVFPLTGKTNEITYASHLFDVIVEHVVVNTSSKSPVFVTNYITSTNSVLVDSLVDLDGYELVITGV